MLTVLRVFESGCAAERLDAARDFLSGFAASTEVIVVGNSRDAADDLVRDLSMGSTATFGFHRFSVMQLAVRFAAVEMARRGLAPSTVLGTEALAARVAFEVIERGELRYFAPVAARPGFAPALAASMRELRACGGPRMPWNNSVMQGLISPGFCGNLKPNCRPSASPTVRHCSRWRCMPSKAARMP